MNPPINCPKCRSSKLVESKRFYGSYADTHFPTYCKEPACGIRLWDYLVRGKRNLGEHLHWLCFCGYSWTTPTADNTGGTHRGAVVPCTDDGPGSTPRLST